MDRRCLRKLKSPPQEFCPAAIARLRWRESLGHEPSEKEEKSAPGCPWAIRSQDDMFCFFKALSSEREPYTDAQIAHLLGVSEATVKRTRKIAIYNLSQLKEFKEIKELHPDGLIIEERLVDPNEEQLGDFSHISVTEVAEEDAVTAEDEGV